MVNKDRECEYCHGLFTKYGIGNHKKACGQRKDEVLRETAYRVDTMTRQAIGSQEINHGFDMLLANMKSCRTIKLICRRPRSNAGSTRIW
jgi:hypothetical protein